MQEINRHERYATGAAPGRPPDQAEGERDDTPAHETAPEVGRPTPGQAEGDRATVDSAIRQHEAKQQRGT